MTADARGALEKIATRCSELSASQSGTEWLRGEIEKIGVMARDAAKIADAGRFAPAVFSQLVPVDLADFFATTTPPVRLARFIEPMPASVTESRVGSKSDASRQSPATTKKSRRAPTKKSPPAGSR